MHNAELGATMKVKVTQSCMTLCDPMQCTVHGILQGIFPTQGLNQCLLHCRWILYQLSHQGSPIILEWVAYLFSSKSSRPRWLSWQRIRLQYGRLGSMLGLGRSPREGKGYPLQYSGLENSMGSIVHGVTKSRT